MFENEVSFCTTALARPEILDRTYRAFFANLKGINLSKCCLYINIDPIPNDDKLCQQTLNVAKKYFERVVFRIPQQPSFPGAINWCWKNADTPYIFHIEDDWVLADDIHMDEINDLLNDDIILEIIFRAYPYKYTKLVLSPSIWKHELYKVFAGKLELDRNPEVQLRDKRFSKCFNTNNIVVFGDVPIVKDIGREWLNNKGLKKPIKGKFVKY